MSYLSGAQVDQLLKGINPSRVGKDGKGFSHVEAYEIRAHLNRIFGFGRWSQDVVEQAVVFETEKDAKWSVAYRSVVKLTVCAPDGTTLATYTEGAIGDAKNQPSRADSHDLACKTSESQALKRCAANLGDQFGNSLYAKGSMKPLVIRTLVMPEDDRSDAQTPVDEGIDPVVAEHGSPADSGAPEVDQVKARQTTNSPAEAGEAPTAQELYDQALSEMSDRPQRQRLSTIMRIGVEASRHKLQDQPITTPEETTLSLGQALDHLRRAA